MGLLDRLKYWFWSAVVRFLRPIANNALAGMEHDAPARGENEFDAHDRRQIRLAARRYVRSSERPDGDAKRRLSLVKPRPYLFAWAAQTPGRYLDLSRDVQEASLARFSLPRLATPEELALWLKIKPGQLAWLLHRFEPRLGPTSRQQSHYHYRWIDKRRGGQRLLEIPKPMLRAAQDQILREILDRVPPHSAAHGFVRRRSICSNAAPHVGQRVVVKFDLENFYPSVSLAKVVAIFRSLGYSREAAIWLGRLTTSIVPADVASPAVLREARQPSRTVYGTEEFPRDQAERALYGRRHLPQGAPTSPALANLAAFALDLRLSGLARRFGARYTRYADDLTFSGNERFLRNLILFLPLVRRVVADERFRVNVRKLRILRNNQRQNVAGVVVNRHLNVARRDYDRLKASLVNCIRRGPSTQNHDRHPDFAASLRGRVAHVSQLNPARGKKLLALYRQVDWNS